MLLRHMEWVGENIRLYLYDTDGDRQEVDLSVAEALDILVWLRGQEARLTLVNSWQIKAMQQQDKTG